MSIYSGFGTRQQETHYNTTVEKILFLLADNIVYTHLREHFNEEKWFRKVRQHYRTLLQMETTKYLLPKFSEGVRDLVACFSSKYSRQNSTVGTEISLRTEKHFPKQFVEENGFISKQKHLRPALQLPFTSGRYKSSSPPSCMVAPPHQPGTYPSTKNSVLKRRQQMSTNASMIEKLEARLSNIQDHSIVHNNTLLFDESPERLLKEDTKQKKSHPEGMAQVASRSSGASAAVQSDNYFRNNSSGRQEYQNLSRGKTAKLVHLNGSPGNQKLFAKSGGAVPTEPYNFAQRKPKSATRPVPYKLSSLVPSSLKYSAQPISAMPAWKADSKGSRPLNTIIKKTKATPRTAVGGKRSATNRFNPYSGAVLTPLRNTGELQGMICRTVDASLEEINNLLIQKQDHHNALRFIHDLPQNGRRSPGAGNISSTLSPPGRPETAAVNQRQSSQKEQLSGGVKRPAFLDSTEQL